MRSLIFAAFLAVLFSPTVLEAQKKCKYDFDEQDPMTEVRVRRNKVKVKRFFLVNFYRKGDEFRVEVEIAMAGERNFVVPKGNELQLKLGNGTILRFPAAEDASPVSYVAGSQIATNFAISHQCTREQMELLAAHGFRVVSTPIGDETYTLEIKEKKVSRNARDAACMLVET